MDHLVYIEIQRLLAIAENLLQRVEAIEKKLGLKLKEEKKE